MSRTVVTSAAVVVATTVATGRWWPVAIGLGVAACRRRQVRLATAVVLLAVGAAAHERGEAATAALAPDALGPFVGWVQISADPQPLGRATRVVVEVEGERYEAWVRGTARSRRAANLTAGDWVVVSGERAALAPGRRARTRGQHIVGELRLDWLGDVAPGGPLARSANRVRRLVGTGMSALPPDQAALARGLVIGDDRDQPQEMVERFRRSGLAHLTAVSGQNVALVLAAASPLLRRARPGLRLVLTLAVIGWFVVVTRAEPSVLRAGVMASLAAIAFATGRSGSPALLLPAAVVGLILVDPLLVWSIGFWLSVGATAGVVIAGPWLTRRLAALGPLAAPFAITIGAQAGVALPSLLVFGRLSWIGLFANLVAVPVAGVVMLVGLPASLLAGAVPAVAPIVMPPIGLAVRFVDGVARVGAALEPSGRAAVVAWLATAAALLWLMTRRGARTRLPD